MATKQEIIKNWAENIADNDDLISIVRQVNSWNGSLEDYINRVDSSLQKEINRQC